METTRIIPENQITENVEHFIVFPFRKMVRVYIKSSVKDRVETVDFSDVWNALTTTQKNVLRKFFKGIAALALKVDETAITGEIT
jgi:hypothetical protein